MSLPSLSEALNSHRAASLHDLTLPPPINRGGPRCSNQDLSDQQYIDLHFGSLCCFKENTHATNNYRGYRRAVYFLNNLRDRPRWYVGLEYLAGVPLLYAMTFYLPPIELICLKPECRLMVSLMDQASGFPHTTGSVVNLQ